jgi:CBS domain-containing protein
VARAGPQPELTQLRVEDVMHRGLVTCGPETPLRTVARILAAHRIHAVVVAEQHAHAAHDVWGVLSDLELVAQLARDGAATAGAVATQPPCVVVPDEKVASATRLMATLGVSHVLVVDPVDRRPIGVVSTLDVADALSR